MVAVGLLLPAVDALAGESRAQHLGNVMSTAASRISIVAPSTFLSSALAAWRGLKPLAVAHFKPILPRSLEKAGNTIETTVPLARSPFFGARRGFCWPVVAAGMMIFAGLRPFLSKKARQ